MNNRNVAHVWAHQQKSEGKGSNLFFVGPTIYSYGLHFPVAKFVTVGKEKTKHVLVTVRSYSISTTKHQGYVYSALSNAQSQARVPVLDVPSMDHFTKVQFARFLRQEEKKMAEHRLSQKQRKIDAVKQTRVRRKKEAAEYPKRLLEWRNHERDSLPVLPGIPSPVMLRLSKDGSRIETSRGAQILTRYAPLVWKRVCDCLLKRGRFMEANEVDFPDFSFDNYIGLRVFRDEVDTPRGGAVQVGCHQIGFDELIPIARQLGYETPTIEMRAKEGVA